MITLIKVKNPIDARIDREILKVEHIDLAKLREEMQEDFGDVVIRVNGNVVTNDAIKVKGNDFVTVCPVVGGGGKGGGGKSWGMTVAMIGLAVVSFGVGGAAAGSHGFLGRFAAMSHWTWASYAAAAATMWIGSTLINRHYGGNVASIDFGSYDMNNDPTYNWNNPETMVGQNNPISILYGTVKSGGQTLGQYIQSLDGKEYLNWLVGCGEGELTSISDIKLNDNDISHYTSITAEKRLGTNDQTIISNFNDTYSTKSVDYDITLTREQTGPIIYHWADDYVPGTGTQGIILRYQFPKGLYQIDTQNGNIATYRVQVHAYYRKVNEPNWHAWLAYQPIDGKQTSALNVEFRIDNLEPGEYEIRTAQTNERGMLHPDTAQANMHLVGITSIVYDDFVYPNIALIGIRGMATSQLSGSPTLSFKKTRANVWVFNPYLNQYVQMDATNPAWASYDMLHQCQRLKDIHTREYVFIARGVKAKDIIYNQFVEWASWCDSHNKKVNIDIDQTGKMIDIINDNIACLGHGQIIRFGTKYGVVWDRPQEPTQMFGMGNIIKDSFTETFTKSTDRANCIEITYNDRQADYARQTIVVYGDTYNTDGIEKMAQITYNGIVDYAQAFAEGKYQLFCNQYLVRTVGIDVSVDAIACMLGDVVLLAHDVPNWGYSGRISNIDGLNVTLPIRMTAPSGESNTNYILAYKTMMDEIIKVPVTIVSCEENYTVVAMQNTPEKMPEKDLLFALANVDYGLKPFVLKNISRTPDPLILHLDLLEYNESIYNEDYEIPEIIYAPPGDVAVNVKNLSASQVSYTGQDGSKKSRMYVSWEYTDDDGNVINNGSKFIVQYSLDEITWTDLVPQTAEMSVFADVDPYNTYYVRVITKLGLTQSTGVVTDRIYPGVDRLPPDVLQLNVETLADGTRRYYWDFEYPEPNDIAGFRIKYTQSLEVSWEDAVKVQEGLITSHPFETKTIRQGQHVVMIKAVDNIGNESAIPAKCIVDFGDLLEDNVLYKVEHSANKWQGITWLLFDNAEMDDKGNIKGVDLSEAWGSYEEDAWSDYEDPAWDLECSLDIAFSFITIASGFWWLQYEFEGAVTILYTLNDDGIFKQYSTRIKVQAGDKITIRISASGGDYINIKKLTSIIDVPDREEHFDDIEITTDGTELSVKTPNYHTTAVRIDSLPIYSGVPVFPQIVSRNPCIIKLVTADGSAVSAIATRITWQGFEKEVIENGD